MTSIKKITALAATVAATALVAAPAQAAPVSDNTGKAKVKIVKPLTISKAGDLDFGTIVLPATPSGASTTVSVSADNTATYSQNCAADGFTCSIANGGASTNVTYTLTGTNNVNVNVDIDPTVTMTRLTGTETIVASLTTNLTNSDADASYDMQLANSGAPGTDFWVGGSLTVADNTVDGVYEGTFTVTADYE
ncbi:DUF4402 domain-containing protein [Sphingomicrobium lutaoense]|uniref:DUF4402 domain-containing protein n=1 Tax=Sphingomicrobium lutaoense TaxID=515949 RepID=A0A839Z4M4_9SPHN|nr:DUF4402 domain-containing protein [Sphingomicrobium lutaoense]MBB3764813.1 hypothetical protein [Sphingomicrobium lutaoense]